MDQEENAVKKLEPSRDHLVAIRLRVHLGIRQQATLAQHDRLLERL